MRRLLDGHSGIRRVEQFRMYPIYQRVSRDKFRVEMDGRNVQSRSVDGAQGAGKVDEFHRLCNVAATQALDDAGWKPVTYEDQSQVCADWWPGLEVRGELQMQALFSRSGALVVSRRSSCRSDHQSRRRFVSIETV